MNGAYGPQTAVVDGQRNIFPTSAQFAPASYGPQTTGVPQVSPTMPPFLGSANGQGASLGYGVGAEHVDGYGTATNNTAVTRLANEHPFSLELSPVVWAIVALVGGILILRGTAWRKTILEGEAGGRVGPASAEARAEA